MKLRNMVIVSALCVFAFGGLSSCGDDATDPEAWVAMLCSKYDECDYLSKMMGMLGNNAAECENKLNELIKSAPNDYDPDPSKKTGCENVDAQACFDGWKAMSCAELTSGKSPPACECSGG